MSMLGPTEYEEQILKNQKLLLSLFWFVVPVSAPGDLGVVKKAIDEHIAETERLINPEKEGRE